MTNLLIGFSTLPHGDTKRYEILQLISTILKLSDEEKQKLGLIRSTKIATSPTSPATPGEGEVKCI
jgi:hypothetical protein